MCPSFLSCFLCVRTFYSISSYLLCMFMCPHLCTISPSILIMHVYVSILICYFTIHCCMLCVQAFYPVSYVSGLFTLFHHTIYVFMYPCFCTISPYILIIYVMYPYYSHYFTTYKFFYMLCIHIYMFSHMNTNSLKIVSIIL